MGGRNYLVVTGAYWAFTITDGALRMLVLLHFYELGYSAVAIAFLFLFYELMGVITNLAGGWVGARSGLNRTLRAGLTLQVVALLTLSLHNPTWAEWVSVSFVMAIQALSGVAKDLTKMSSKSAVKLVAGSAEGRLFRLVALLTGGKNALKGVGFFIGATQLSRFGFDAALYQLAGLVAVALVAVVVAVNEPIGRAGQAPGLKRVLSPSSAINRLSAARLFLFGARDIWFVVALPVFLTESLGWSHERVGGFLAAWVIGYGIVQSAAPTIASKAPSELDAARTWIAILTGISAAVAVLVASDVAVVAVVVGGVIAFGLVFAINSSLHSFLILAYSQSDDDIALDVGFYYAANAIGRLAGTLLSGLLYLFGGLDAAMLGSTGSLVIAWLLTMRLPVQSTMRSTRATAEGPAKGL